MATAVKKARRLSGVKFTKPAKTPTPLADRHEFRESVMKPAGLREQGKQVPRSEKKLAALRKKWGVA